MNATQIRLPPKEWWYIHGSINLHYYLGQKKTKKRWLWVAWYINWFMKTGIIDPQKTRAEQEGKIKHSECNIC